eukprot:EG_transcript_11091
MCCLEKLHDRRQRNLTLQLRHLSECKKPQPDVKEPVDGELPNITLAPQDLRVPSSQHHGGIDRLVVVARCTEPVGFLREFGWPYVVMQKGAPKDYPYGAPAWSREASSFTKYIIAHYCSGLPNRVAFIHAHDTSWHHEGSIQDLLGKVDWEAYDFAPINTPYTGWHATESLIDWLQGHDDLREQLRHLRPAVMDCPEKVERYTVGSVAWRRGCRTRFVAASQFIVHRSRILQLPLSFWIRYHNLLVEHKRTYPDGRPCPACNGYTAEWSWQYLLGGTSFRYLLPAPACLYPKDWHKDATPRQVQQAFGRVDQLRSRVDRSWVVVKPE